ncbi:MAG: hypothetical protein JXB26_03545 [Candidatus Aminicenantes bacterium]|nr:hypothetical protein [Candidatus Aminicenantes bacterium]
MENGSTKNIDTVQKNQNKSSKGRFIGMSIGLFFAILCVCLLIFTNIISTKYAPGLKTYSGESPEKYSVVKKDRHGRILSSRQATDEDLAADQTKGRILNAFLFGLLAFPFLIWAIYSIKDILHKKYPNNWRRVTGSVYVLSSIFIFRLSRIVWLEVKNEGGTGRPDVVLIIGICYLLTGIFFMFSWRKHPEKREQIF